MTDFDERDSVLRRASAKAYIEKYRAKFGLTDWDVRFVPFPDEGDQATLEYRLPEKAAQIGIDPDAPFNLIETLIIHEMTHLALKPLSVLMENLIAKQKDDTFRDYLADSFEEAEEEVVESITRALGGIRYVAYGSIKDRLEAFAS